MGNWERIESLRLGSQSIFILFLWIVALLAAQEEQPLHGGELGDHTADLLTPAFLTVLVLSETEKHTQQETA